MDEFELIRRYFSRPSDDKAVRVAVGDDGAVLRPAPGRDLVAVVDTLVEGIHYPASLDATDLGFRAVAVNLSDIAAMGARPRWMTLALTIADADPGWLDGFATGLFSAADEHAVSLVGGDTTRGAQTVVSVQLIGDVDPGQLLARSGASPGDYIFVSGTVGDAAAGLHLIESDTADTGDGTAVLDLIARFRRPSPRVALGARIASLASAAIDVSDGLYADLNRLLESSGCGGQLELERLPMSTGLLKVFGGSDAQALALSGGDDYELCFTAPVTAGAALADISDETGIPVTRIGEVVDGRRLVCTDNGATVDFEDAGYVHFRSAKP